MLPKGFDRLEFSYETCASHSYLVIKGGLEDTLIEYQVSMLQKNQMGTIITPELKHRDGSTFIFYDITSMLSLSFFLKRRRLVRNEFIRLLADIARTVTECAGYLLYDSSLILEPDHIYINPETLAVTLIYVPISADASASETLKAFVTDLILNHANMEDEACDNFLQRILANLKKDNFNVRSFLQFLNGLLYKDGETSAEIGSPLPVNEEKAGATGAAHYTGKTTTDLQAVRSTNLEQRRLRVNPSSMALAVVLQPVLLLMAVFIGKFAVSAGSSPNTAYLGVAFIALSLDLLIIKNLLKNRAQVKAEADASEKNIIADIHDKERRATTRAKEAEVKLSPSKAVITKAPDRNPDSEQGMVETVNAEVTEKNSEVPKPRPPGKSHTDSNKTVLLSLKKAGIPMLVSRKPEEYPDIVLDKKEFIIGRLIDQVDQVLSNNAVGKVHASILNRNDSYYIKDLNSINGTYINNIRIDSNKDCEIKENDSVMLANSEYVFTLM